MSFYLQVFTEAAHTASIIPLGSEWTLAAMKSFGGYNLSLACAIAAAGAMVGQLFNWGVGRFLLKLKRTTQLHVPQEQYDRLAVAFQKYVVFALLFCWVPFFNFLTLAAAFLGVRLKTALPLIIVGLAGYYGWYAM
jgi:membrane protein YqaA with SNARE-associated domain